MVRKTTVSRTFQRHEWIVKATWSVSIWELLLSFNVLFYERIEELIRSAAVRMFSGAQCGAGQAIALHQLSAVPPYLATLAPDPYMISRNVSY